MDIASVISWLFSSRTGVVTLLVVGLLAFLIAAICLERKTRRDFDRYDDLEDDAEDGWSVFEEDNQ